MPNIRRNILYNTIEIILNMTNLKQHSLLMWSLNGTNFLHFLTKAFDSK